MFNKLKEDIQSVKDRDPAAKSTLEILFLYPGFKAIRRHRRAHWFYTHKLFFIARFISNRTAKKTGIEIHPGAVLGRGLFIDHGTGVVIGETTVIGDNVTIYQGATLGGTGKETGKRHPTIGNNVMIGSGAKVLGPFTIGNNVNIAAGAVVLEAIPDNCTAVGVPARIVRMNGKKVDMMDHVHVPDPIAQQFCILNKKIDDLEKELKTLKGEESKNENI